MIFMLSLNIIKAFDQVLHIRLLHMLKMRRMLSYIIKWARSFLKNRKTLLIFNEQTSTTYEINANISQEFLISLILFLFFNASLIEKCKALRIKIEVLNFINDINILVYDRFIEEICKIRKLRINDRIRSDKRIKTLITLELTIHSRRSSHDECLVSCSKSDAQQYVVRS